MTTRTRRKDHIKPPRHDSNSQQRRRRRNVPMEIKFLLYLQQIKMQTKMRSGSRYLWLLSSCWSSALNLQQQLDLISVIGGDEEDRRERESCEREREREREREKARAREEWRCATSFGLKRCAPWIGRRKSAYP